MATTMLPIPGLDGLRAVSILLVIIAHCGFAKVPRSLSVTIFFFISGYLITTLNLKESEAKGNIEVGKFYVRRYVRLMPELVAYTLIASLMSYLFFTPHRLIEILGSLFYFTNYLRVFSPSINDAPFSFGQLWSLAVEEHFYLTWPLVFSLCVKSKRLLLAAAMAFIVFGLCGRLVAVGMMRRWIICVTHPNAASTPSGMDASLRSGKTGLISD